MLRLSLQQLRGRTRDWIIGYAFFLLITIFKKNGTSNLSVFRNDQAAD